MGNNIVDFQEFIIFKRGNLLYNLRKKRIQQMFEGLNQDMSLNKKDRRRKKITWQQTRISVFCRPSTAAEKEDFFRHFASFVIWTELGSMKKIWTGNTRVKSKLGRKIISLFFHLCTRTSAFL